MTGGMLETNAGRGLAWQRKDGKSSVPLLTSSTATTFELQKKVRRFDVLHRRNYESSVGAGFALIAF